MNSLQLIQQVSDLWLTEPEQSQLSLRDTESLLVAINSAQRSVWAALPVTYRSQTISIDFAVSQADTVNVTAGSRVINSGLAGVGTPDFCSLVIAGDTSLNEYRKPASVAGLLHPYRGTSGTKTVTVYHDAVLLPYQVDRLTSVLACRETRRAWQPTTSISKRLNFPQTEQYSLQVVSLRGASYTLARISPGNDKALTFEAEAIIRPAALTLLDSSGATVLPYGDDVGQWIAMAAGTYLQRHPKFRGELAKLASDSVMDVRQQIDSIISPGMLPGENTIGTPDNW